MNTRENTGNDLLEDVIVLGVASIETEGGVFDPGETMGLNIGTGISDE